MKNKLSDKSLENQRKEKIMRFSIRKYSFGAASVAVAAFLMFLGNGAVAADQLKVTEESSSKVELAQSGGEKAENQSESGISEPKISKAELDKSQLANYIGEIEGKISSGAYANKTEESVASLAAELANAKATLANASSQEELTSAYQKLVATVNSKLRNKLVEKKEIVQQIQLKVKKQLVSKLIILRNHQNQMRLKILVPMIHVMGVKLKRIQHSVQL